MTTEKIKKNFLKDSFYLMLASLAEKFFFFIVNIIIARYLTREHFGEYSTALSFATFFSLFSNLGIGFSSVRLISREHELKDRHYSGSQVVKILVSVLAYLFMCCGLYFTGYNTSTIYLTLILGIVRIGNEYLLYLFSLMESVSKFNLISVFTSLFALSFMSATFCVVLLNGDYWGIVLVRLAVVILFIAAALLSVRKFFRFGWVRVNEIKVFTRETLPFGISYIFNTTTLNFAPIILPLYHGTILTGVYNNAYIFFTSLLFIPAALGKVIMPYLYRYDFNSEGTLYKNFYYSYAKLLSIVSFYCLDIFLYFGDDLIKLIFGAKYLESIRLLVIMAIAIPFAFNIAPSIIPTMNKQKINSMIDTTIWIAYLPLSIILIRIYSAEGAAVSIVIIYFISYLLSNLYLVYRGIGYSKIFLFRLGLSFLSAALYLAKNYMATYCHFIFNAAAITFLYFITVYLLFLGKNEKLFLRNTFSKKIKL